MFKNGFFIVAIALVFLPGCQSPKQKETANHIIKKLSKMKYENVLSDREKKAKNTRFFYQQLTKEASNILSITWNAVLAYKEHSESHQLANLTEKMQSIGFFLTTVAESFVTVGKEARGSWTIIDYKKKVTDSLMQEFEANRQLSEELNFFDANKKENFEEKKNIIRQYVEVLVKIAQKNISSKMKEEKTTK